MSERAVTGPDTLNTGTMDSDCTPSASEPSPIDINRQSVVGAPSTATYAYDAFVSYATDPDRDLVRQVEVFLESLDRNPVIEPRYRRSFEICVDGSDFHLPRRTADRAGAVNEVRELVVAYLRQSRTLIVFTGPTSASHPWVNFELEWWLEHRPADPVFLVVSHGRDPRTNRDETFPKAALQHCLDQGLWFDLRGATRRTKEAVSVRPYEEERLRLAAALSGPDVSATDLIRSWKIADARARKRRILIRAFVGALLGAMALFGARATLQERESQRRERSAGWALISQQTGASDSSRLLDSVIYATAATAETASADASTALISAAQLLPRHLATYRHDDGAHAVDIVRFLAQDRILLSAGYTGIAQFASASTGAVLGRVALSGRASSVAVHPRRNLLAFGTQRGVDLIEYGEDANAPAPRLVARATLRERVRDVLFDPNKESILFGTFEGTIGSLPLMTADVAWKSPERTQMRDRMGATIGIMGLVPDWDRDQLVVFDIEGEVHCADLHDLAHPRRTAKHTSEIFGVDRHPEIPAAIVSDSSGGLAFFNIESCAFEGAIATPSTAQTMARDSGGEWRGSRVVQAARTGIRYSRDGKLIGVAGHDGTVRVYTANDHALIRVVALGDATRSLDFDASGERLAIGSDSGAISLWELATVESWGVAGAEAFAVDPRGRWVIARGDDQRLRVFDAATGMVRAAFASSDASLNLNDLDAMVITPDGSSLAGRLSSSTSVPVWSLASVERDGTLPPPIQLRHSNVRGHVALVSAVGVTPDGELITAERRDGHSVRVWKSQSGEERLSVEFENPVFQVAAAAERLAAIDNGGLLRVVSLATQTEIASARLQWQPQALALASDGKTLFVAGASGESMLGAVCAIDHPFPTEALWRRVMRWRPLAVSAKAVMLPSARSTITTTGLACRFLGLKEGVRDAAFSPDGRRLAIGMSGAALTQPGTVMLLYAELAWSGRQERAPAAIRTMAFSPDSRILAVGMQERGITLWRTDDMTTDAAIPLANPVRRLAFLPDAARKLVSLDGVTVGLLRIWDWRREVLISAGCERWPETYAVRPIPSVPEPPQRSALCSPERVVRSRPGAQ